MIEGAPSGSVPVQGWQPDEGGARVNLGQGERLASTVGGGLLALWGLSRLSLSGLALVLSGGALMYRGMSGHCFVYEKLGIGTTTMGEALTPSEIRIALTIARPRDRVYAAWRDFEQLPRFMHHLESVTRLDERRYHWVARAPAGVGTIEWDVDLVEDRVNELIAWQSVPGSEVRNSGWVSFRDAPQAGATGMYVELLYRSAGGELGAALDRWLTPVTRQLIEEDIRRVKHHIESGFRNNV